MFIKHDPVCKNPLPLRGISPQRGEKFTHLVVLHLLVELSPPPGGSGRRPRGLLIQAETLQEKWPKGEGVLNSG